MTTSALQAALPDYEISRELGRGAMGVVYQGRHRALDRLVAIKELPPSFAVDPAVRDRFLTEARVVAALDHPHVVVIHDFVDRDGHLALVMEHLPNGTVWDQFVSQGLAAPRACGLALATLAGVHHAHDRGIMHRDIKPENLIFTHDWQLKVTDFGIAQVLSGDETMGTAEGAIVGTPAYMAPEQAEGRPCGPQADVYASGAMLYEMLTGALPFPHATDALSMAKARLTNDPVPIQSVGPVIPGAIADVVMQSLARSESDRYPTAEAFGVALGEAAAETWGIEWMSEAGTSVRGSAAIEHASRTTRGSSAVADPVADPPAEVDARPTAFDEAAPPLEDDRATSLGGPPTLAPQQRVADAASVVPAQREHAAGADLHDLVPSDMLNLSQVKAPRSPIVPAALAILGLGVAVLLALVGSGQDPAAPASSQVLVAGSPVDGAEVVEVDLTEPFTIDGVDPAERLNATFLGVPIGSAPVEDGAVDPGYLRYSGAGVIEFTPDVEGAESFPVRSSNSVYPTAPFVVAAMVALGGFASVQSNLRGLRSRRFRLSPFVGLAISGAVAGAGAAVLSMLVLQTPAALSFVIATAAATAFGSLALGEAYRRWRRRRRLRNVTVASARRTP